MDRSVTQGTTTKATDQNYSTKIAGDAAYTVLDGDKYDLVTVAPGTARTITLPTLAANQSRILTILNLNGTDIVTADGEGAETINGGTDETLVSANDFITVIGTPATWAVLGRKQSYNTGWINRSDWTDVEIGSDTTKDTDSNVTHNLDTVFSDLFVKVLVSTDGTDPNSFEIVSAYFGANQGVTFHGVDNDNIIVTIGTGGTIFLAEGNTGTQLTTQDWYYKVSVFKLG